MSTPQGQTRVRYQALGPLLAGEGSRAFLGLEIYDDAEAEPCVLVWVPEAAASDMSAVTVLKKETDRASMLEHPNVVKVHGLVALDEGLARVVDFLDGESLRRVLEVVRALPPQFAAKVVADAAMGIHFAHLAGNDDGEPLVHGDLRPETLMITFEGAAKVAGYGALTLAPKEHQGKRVKGRRLYVAPEQMAGGRDASSRQTNVYMLGLVLYECVTGKRPFGGVAPAHGAKDIEPFPTLDSDGIPPNILEVIRRATLPNAAERYPSALALKESLEAAVSGLPTTEAFAVYLRKFFPESDPARAARRRELDAGIAEFRRRHGLAPAPAAVATPSRASNGHDLNAPAPPPVRPSPPPSRPAPKQVAARPSWEEISPRREVDSDDDEPAPSRPGGKRLSWPVIGVGGAVALLLVMWMSRDGKKPTDVLKERPSAAAPSESPPPRAEPPKSEVATVRTKPVAPAPVQPEPVKEAAPPPPAPAPKPAEPPSLSVTADPPMEVSIAGKSLGTTPVLAPMAAGRYVVKLSNATSGINTTRTVVVGQKGKTSVDVRLKKGFVTVAAPEGAVIAIDGKVLGKAPVGEINVFEGSHKIVVTMGKAKWQQAFSVRPDERMYFNVESSNE